MNLQTFLEHYGYLALFLGTFLEGETVLILAGFLASQGYFDFPKVVAIAFAGAYAGHSFYYFLGRWQGTRLVLKVKLLSRHYARAKNFLAAYGPLAILITQFIYGARLVSAISFGALGMKPRKFFSWELLVVLFWALVIATLGYSFGRTLQVFLGDLKRYEKTILIYMLAVALVYAGGHLAWTLIKNYRRNRLSLKQGENNGKGGQNEPPDG